MYIYIFHIPSLSFFSNRSVLCANAPRVRFHMLLVSVAVDVVVVDDASNVAYVDACCLCQVQLTSEIPNKQNND